MVPNSDPCGFGTTGYLTALNMENGGPPVSPPFDYNNDGIVDDNDLVSNLVPSRQEGGGGIADPKSLGDNIYDSDPSGNTDRTGLPPIEGSRTGRLSWQELL